MHQFGYSVAKACNLSRLSHTPIWLAIEGTDGGFDRLWAVEYHDDNYLFCPYNLQLMSNPAAKHPHIDAGNAAVILRWNDPPRLAEKVSMLSPLHPRLPAFRCRLRLSEARVQHLPH